MATTELETQPMDLGLTLQTSEPVISLPTQSAPVPFRFPGGASATQTSREEGWLSLSLQGELDVFDRYAVIDLLTSYLLGGCLIIRIDASQLEFVDVAVLRSFDQVRRSLARQGGSLAISGLSQVSQYVWDRLRASHSIDGTVTPLPETKPRSSAQPNPCCAA